MFDIGGSELILIGVVALIVIGPKDLPEMFRQLGRVTGKMRSMARDFQRAMDQAAKESGVSDVAKDLKTATSSKSLGIDAVRQAANKFEKWDPIGNTLRPTTPATPATPVVAPAAATPAAVMGPATAALAEKQAQKKAILQETAAKLKAVDSPPVAVAAKSAAKTRAKAAKPAVAETASAPKPRKTPKKADTV
jgi:sec-independent protein translocase protein TatB